MKVRRKVTLLFMLLCLLSLANMVRAQEPVKWSAKVAASSVKEGDKFAVKIRAQIESGWHIYSITQPAGGPIRTKITVPDGQPFKPNGTVTGPRPRLKFDHNFEMETETYAGSVSFNVPITVASSTPVGTTQVEISVRFQGCNETICLPPATIKVRAPVALLSGATAPALIAANAMPTPFPTPRPTITREGAVKDGEVAESATQLRAASPADAETSVSDEEGTPDRDTRDPANDKRSETSDESFTAGSSTGIPSVAGNTLSDANNSLWSFIRLAMMAGALSLLTPCVFPMIPITVSYFTSHAAGNKRQAVNDASGYAIGIILTFTALGGLLALVFGATGLSRFAASPWTNLLIASFFIAFSLSLLGAFELRLPSTLLTRLDAISRRREEVSGRGRVVALLLMGLTFSLTSFTCTAPFVGTLLVMAAQGHWIYPVLGLLSFSTVFALPFFALALAPQLVSQMPRSGGWLNVVKVVMGLLEIAAAMKFLSNVDLVWRWGLFTREIVLASWVAVAVLISLYLLGKLRLSHDTEVERIGAPRVFLALISLSLIFFLTTGLFGARLGELESFLPPPADVTTVPTGLGVAGGGDLQWLTNDYDSALERARRESKLVFIDFTGYTCTNCRWMEANMFTKSLVRQELERYVRLRLYTDGDGAVYERQQSLQQQKFGTVALPYYTVVDGTGKVLSSFAGLTRDEVTFLSFLRGTE
jgi:thiol:disulfide interchange protein DsbD